MRGVVALSQAVTVSSLLAARGMHARDGKSKWRLPGTLWSQAERCGRAANPSAISSSPSIAACAAPCYRLPSGRPPRPGCDGLPSGLWAGTSEWAAAFDDCHCGCMAVSHAPPAAWFWDPSENNRPLTPQMPRLRLSALPVHRLTGSTARRMCPSNPRASPSSRMSSPKSSRTTPAERRQCRQ